MIFAISRTAMIILCSVAAVLLFMIISVIIYKVVRFSKKKQIAYTFEEFLKKYCSKDKEKRKYTKSTVPEYDYILETGKYRMYIMAVYNPQYWEIKINSPTKWQYRMDNEDESVHFVPRVDRLMRFDPPYDPAIKSVRVYVIYPSIRSILRQINECEMEFVHFTTDVNGCRVITFPELRERIDTIEF